MGKVATEALPPGASPPLQSRGQNKRWPTSGQGGYKSLAAWGIPTASERGAESKVAHKWARWLHNPCRLGDTHRFRAGARIRGGPQVDKVATEPLPPGGYPPLQSGGHNQRWPTSGHGGYITPAAWGIPTASERGAESEVAHKWARWLQKPCRLGRPHRFRARGRFRSGSSQKWKISFFGGHATKRGFQSGGTISEIAHKWAQWQSEVGKLIFWVSHLLSKKFFFY